jgi:hypothetical protein
MIEQVSSVGALRSRVGRSVGALALSRSGRSTPAPQVLS